MPRIRASELIAAIEDGLRMWDLIHMEHYGESLSTDDSHDGDAFRRLSACLLRFKHENQPTQEVA